MYMYICNDYNVSPDIKKQFPLYPFIFIINGNTEQESHDGLTLLI